MVTAASRRKIRLTAEHGVADLPPSHLVLEYRRGDIRAEIRAMAQATRRALPHGTG